MTEDLHSPDKRNMPTGSVMNTIKLKGFDIPQYDTALKSLREVVRLYKRSNKRGRNTCEAMYAEAKSALAYIDELAREQKRP